MNQPTSTPADTMPSEGSALHATGPQPASALNEKFLATYIENRFEDRLARGAEALGMLLDASTIVRCLRFAALLEEGNRHLNLTRVRPEDVVTLHFLDSLALASVHPPEAGTRVLDVGTGAGFPGVPLALAYPALEVTLMDSTRKRLTFLEEALAAIGVENTHTLHARAEELARDPRHREQYDLVVARAVAPMTTLAGWLLPFVRTGGLAVAYKSREAQPEIEAARATIGHLGAVVEQVVDIRLPETDIDRKLVLLRKVRALPARKLAERKRK